MPSDTVLDIATPVVVFYMMLVVGIDLTVEDFRRLPQYPKALLIGIVGQLLFLPSLAMGLVHAMHLKPFIAAGILLIAACSGGGNSNFYTYLARANTALSVSLTAISCLTAFVSMPLIMKVFEQGHRELALFKVPLGPMMTHLAVFLVLPILLGMTLRRLLPEFTTSNELHLRPAA